jgi:hypothetical protein
MNTPFRRSAILVGRSLSLLALLAATSAAQLVPVAPLDDFGDGTNLKPFGPAFRPARPGCDGTDYQNAFAPWTVENNFQNGFTCLEPGYDGWTLLDVDSWIAEQDGQERDFSGLLGAGTRNTILCADPDAADDFGGGASPDNYNSMVFRDYDISGADLATLAVTLKWEFRCEDLQIGRIDVSFDGGADINLLLVDSTDPACQGPGQFQSGTPTYDSSNGLVAPANAQSMRLKFTCTGGNDWWFAIDDISVDDTNGNLAFEDFESYGPLLPFQVADCPGEFPQVGDGTDWSDEFPNDWKVDNSEMLAGCEEGAYNGFRLIDCDMWILEQDGDGRSKFALFEANNTIFCADPDAYYDFPPEGGQPSLAFNSYACRTYDISGFDPDSLVLDLEWEFRVEDTQRGMIQVKYDDGPWQTLLDIDSDATDGDGNLIWPDGTQLDDETLGQTGTWSATDGDFSGCGRTLTVRFCCIDGGNDWWFAFDNIELRGEEAAFILGDANGDRCFDFGDIQPFSLALLDPTQFAADFPDVNPDLALDMNGDGSFDFGDIEAFANALLGF